LSFSLSHSSLRASWVACPGFCSAELSARRVPWRSPWPPRRGVLRARPCSLPVRAPSRSPLRAAHALLATLLVELARPRRALFPVHGRAPLLATTCRTPAPSPFPSSPGRSFTARAVFPSSDSASHRCPIRVNTRPWSCSSSSPTLCCRFDCRRCWVPHCVPAECCLLYLITRACRWLALTITRLLVVTAAHSLFVHRTSRVLAFVVELLNPSSLARDFVVA
jgi:hypothetical protein